MSYNYCTQLCKVDIITSWTLWAWLSAALHRTLLEEEHRHAIKGRFPQGEPILSFLRAPVCCALLLVPEGCLVVGQNRPERRSTVIRCTTIWQRSRDKYSSCGLKIITTWKTKADLKLFTPLPFNLNQWSVDHNSWNLWESMKIRGHSCLVKSIMAYLQHSFKWFICYLAQYMYIITIQHRCLVYLTAVPERQSSEQGCIEAPKC